MVGFAGLALDWGLGFWLLAPWFDQRGFEWSFYESAGRHVPPDAPLALLYDDWDRNPYDSPFGAIPHDLAVRLFYLGRPARWYFLSQSGGRGERTPLLPGREAGAPLYVIGRDRDVRALGRLGRVEVVSRGPRVRWDRAYSLFRVVSRSDEIGSSESRQTRTVY
jgi:hypothetical protein